MRVLGLDPGSRHAGYGVVERVGSRVRSIACGRISPDPGQSQASRLATYFACMECGEWQKFGWKRPFPTQTFAKIQRFTFAK